MKQYIIAVLSTIAMFLTTACSTDEIELYNTQNTPDLSNPIIQKVSNIVWYNELSAHNTEEVWSSQNNIYKPSDFASSLLYQAAWTSLALYRDGTSNMVFLPPFLPNAPIHAQGNWTVSTEEENTIILTTKTPVSSVTGKLKVLNLETKDNVSILKISLDFGDRLMVTTLSNENPYTYIPTPQLAALDYSWFAERTVSTEALKASDFIGDWINYNDDELVNESMIRYTHMEDLLMDTPAFPLGFSFNLEGNGIARIVYSSRTYKNVFPVQTALGSTVFSNAKWEVKGNKILIATDEELFMALGEQLFGFTPYSNNLTLLGYIEAAPIRIQGNQLYSLEIVEKTTQGFWTRITTKTETCYAFLKKATIDKENLINIKDIFK